MQSIDRMGVGLARDRLSTTAAQNRSKPSELTGADIQAIMKAHNEVRAKYGVAPLTWDNSLANWAKTWADTCYWGHWRTDKTRNAMGGDYVSPLGVAGENLSVWLDPRSTMLSGQYGTQLWVNEEPLFDCPSGQCRGGGMCGHYTQMVWEGTKRIGCALRTCEQGIDPRSWTSSVKGVKGVKYLVCQYSPPGNFTGKPPFAAEKCVGAKERGQQRAKRKITSERPIEQQRTSLRQRSTRELPVVVEETTVQQGPAPGERVVPEEEQWTPEEARLLYPTRPVTAQPSVRPRQPTVGPVDLTRLIGQPQQPGQQPTTILPPQGVFPPTDQTQPGQPQPMTLIPLQPNAGQRTTQPGQPVALIELERPSASVEEAPKEKKEEEASPTDENAEESAEVEKGPERQAIKESEVQQPEDAVNAIPVPPARELALPPLPEENDKEPIDVWAVTGMSMLGALVLGVVVGVIVWYVAWKKPHEKRKTAPQPAASYSQSPVWDVLDQ